MKAVAIGRLARFINGRAFKPSEWELEGLPIIRIQNLTGSSNVVNYFSGEVQPRYLVTRGDILISWSASLGVYKWEGEEAILNQHIFKALPNESLVDRDYFYYALSSVLDEMLAQVHGTTMRHITKEPFEATKIPVPALPEQRRIAGILAKADRLRRLRRYALELSDTYLQSVFLEMFGDPVTNPMGWELTTVSRLKANLSYGTSAKCYSEPVGLPVLRIPNVLSKDIDLTDLKFGELPAKEIEKLTLRKGDLLFVRTNGNPDYVGRCAVFDLEGRFLYASYLIRARLNLQLVNPWFLATYLHLPAGRQAMFPFIRTTAGQSNIGMEGLGQITVPLPPHLQQQQFSEVVHRFDRLRAQQREALRQAEHLFQTLLHQAFEGEV